MSATAFMSVSWTALNVQVLSVYPSVPVKNFAVLVGVGLALRKVRPAVSFRPEEVAVAKDGSSSKRPIAQRGIQQ